MTANLPLNHNHTMTLEKQSFEGLMSSLNLDDEFLTYEINETLNYHQLSIIKANIESQLTKLFDILHHNLRSDMTSELTIDGFPRNDIDVVSVRLVRVKIIRLRNDHKRILTMIEGKLVDQLSINSTTTNDNYDHANPIQSNIPFAVIDDVLIDSPAAKSGLQKGDKIIIFDQSIHAGNHNNLKNLVTRVQHNIDKPITIDILRDQRLLVELTPSNNWQGKGLLGCKILPI